MEPLLVQNINERAAISTFIRSNAREYLSRYPNTIDVWLLMLLQSHQAELDEWLLDQLYWLCKVKPHAQLQQYLREMMTLPLGAMPWLVKVVTLLFAMDPSESIDPEKARLINAYVLKTL